MSVFKILRQGEWEILQNAGRSVGSPDDVRDGYVHLSTGAQVPQTLMRHFTGDESLWLVELVEAALGGDVRWEVARGGERFPHLYRQMELRDVARAAPIGAGHPLPYGL
jgi:uncharacterized protein (DUF952 family)